MGIGQLVMMPLFFASSALYPLAVMPGWLKLVARVNPLTYEVEGLRGCLLGGGRPVLDLLAVSASSSCLRRRRRARTRGRSCSPSLHPAPMPTTSQLVRKGRNPKTRSSPPRA